MQKNGNKYLGLQQLVDIIDGVDDKFIDVKTDVKLGCYCYDAKWVLAATCSFVPDDLGDT